MSSEKRHPLMGHTQDPSDVEYATPPEIWRPLSRALDGFDVDPCSGAEPTPLATTRYTKADDGLSQAWHGAVFVNPPWSSKGDAQEKYRWLKKARSEAKRDDVDVVLMLLPADTSAHWFHRHVLAAEAICLVGPGRISFLGGDRNPSFQLCISAFGDVTEELVDALDTLGVVIEGRAVHESVPQSLLGGDGA